MYEVVFPDEKLGLYDYYRYIGDSVDWCMANVGTYPFDWAYSRHETYNTVTAFLFLHSEDAVAFKLART